MAEDIPMTKEHREILRKHRIELEENLQPLKLLSHLTEILSRSDEEDVRAERTTSEQTRQLLDIIARKGDKAFEIFVQALGKKQSHLAKSIAEEGGMKLTNSDDGYSQHCMKPRHKEILRSNRGMLQGIKLDKVLSLMKVILDDDDMEEINSKTTPTERLDKFIDILTKKDDKAFNHFVNVLNITDPSFSKFLMKEDGKLESESVESGLKEPTQVNPEDDTEIHQVKHKLKSFYAMTNQNDGWKRLANEFQIPLETVQDSPDPMSVVIDKWSSTHSATVGGLKQALTRLGMTENQQCLENDLRSDVTDAPAMYVPAKIPEDSMVAFVKGIDDLSLANADQKPEIITRCGELNKKMLSKLYEVIKEEMKEKDIPVEQTLYYEETLPIRELTSKLRELGLTGSIMWMKKNLPSGVTGPLCAETMNVRDMPYSVRSKLTLHLCADDRRWKELAGRLGLENVQINYFDSHRFRNPADEVLKQWETKRNSTVGDLYDILVDLNMPVIADDTL